MIPLITEDLIQATLEAARRSPRRRMNHNFHTGPGDNPHRFLNVLLEGTYVAPHRHLKPPKAESFLVMEGYVALFCFEDDGRVRSRHLLGQGALPPDLPRALAGIAPARGIDLEPGVWHTLTALAPYAVCYEVKPGPWDPATDKEFAPWAPQEGDPATRSYLRQLLDGIQPVFP
jgi:cupin fold WbuC family metalloprotein